MLKYARCCVLDLGIEIKYVVCRSEFLVSFLVLRLLGGPGPEFAYSIQYPSLAVDGTWSF
jgi:hypothetical protein